MHIICNIDGAIAINGAIVRPRESCFDLAPAFIDFLHACAAWPLALSLVSEEPEHIVQALLDRRRFGHLPVFARRRVGSTVENPFGRDDCPASGGVCKCAIAGLWSQPRWPVTVYVGHARSDACVARHADVLFACGELAALARASARPFVPYETFDDVRRGLERRLTPMASSR